MKTVKWYHQLYDTDLFKSLDYMECELVDIKNDSVVIKLMDGSTKEVKINEVEMIDK